MKKGVLRPLFVFTFVALLTAFLTQATARAAIDTEKVRKAEKIFSSMNRQEKINAMEKAAEQKYKYTANIPNFNGKMDIKERDKSGSVIGEEPIVLALAEGVKAPQGAAKPGGQQINWQDVSRYEEALLQTHDPVNKWFVENLWRARINKVLAAVEKKAKEKYPNDYQKINVSVRDVAIALGIPVPKNGPPIGPLTNQPILKEGLLFGAKTQKIEGEYINLSLDAFANNMDEWFREFWSDIVVNLDGATNFQS